MAAKPLLGSLVRWETHSPRWAILRRIPRQPRRVFPLILIIFSLTTFFYLQNSFDHPRQLLPLRHGPNSEEHHHPSTSPSNSPSNSPSPSMTAFWSNLTAAFFAADPKVREIQAQRQFERADFDPENKNHKLGFDNLDLPQKHLESLKSKHAEFVDSLATIAPLLPFRANGRGIVMTASGEYLGVAITSLLMLRRAGSKLPVEVFLSSADEHAHRRCVDSLSRLNAKCINMDQFLHLVPGLPTPSPTSANTTADGTLSLSRYQFKAFALLFSTPQSVLFLDADAFPIHNPDRLLRNEPFRSHGLVTWPDFWLPTVSPFFWEISGRGSRSPPEPVTIDSRSTESGIMIVDKRRHAETLILAAYYGLYGPQAYYPLHSQTAWGEGDKETFRLAAIVLERPVWHVHEPARMLTEDKVHDGSGIRQADPEEDWNKWLRGQEEEVRMDKSPRWLFTHTNRIKIDSRRLNSSVGQFIYMKLDEPGSKHTRLWGDDSASIIKDAGFDLEKAIWEEILKADCTKTYLEECDNLREFYNSVFSS